MMQITYLIFGLVFCAASIAFLINKDLESSRHYLYLMYFMLILWRLDK